MEKEKLTPKKTIVTVIEGNPKLIKFYLSKLQPVITPKAKITHVLMKKEL